MCIPPEFNQGLVLDLVFFCGELRWMGSHLAHEEGPSLGEQCKSRRMGKSPLFQETRLGPKLQEAPRRLSQLFYLSSTAQPMFRTTSPSPC